MRGEYYVRQCWNGDWCAFKYDEEYSDVKIVGRSSGYFFRRSAIRACKRDYVRTKMMEKYDSDVLILGVNPYDKKGWRKA